MPYFRLYQHRQQRMIDWEAVLMKKYSLFLSILAALLCLMAPGCSRGNTSASSLFGQAFPEDITSIEVSCFYNGSGLEPRELTQEEIEALGTWLSELSLAHRTYGRGEAPNEVWSGGTSCRFDVNSGALSFSWSSIDQAYIVYGGEWYEITNDMTPPLDLDL